MFYLCTQYLNCVWVLCSMCYCTQISLYICEMNSYCIVWDVRLIFRYYPKLAHTIGFSSLVCGEMYIQSRKKNAWMMQWLGGVCTTVYCTACNVIVSE